MLLQIPLGVVNVQPNASTVTWTEIQGISFNAGTGTTQTHSVTSTPTTGNVGIVAAYSGGIAQCTFTTVKDSNSNSYTISPNSPSGYLTGNGNFLLAYVLSEPSNATSSITVTVSPSCNFGWFFEEFHRSTGSATLDTDAASLDTTHASPINTPTLTPAQAKELLLACALGSASIQHPVAGVALGVWTGAAAGIATGAGCEFILGGTASATAVNFQTGGGNVGWSAMEIAFK